MYDKIHYKLKKKNLEKSFPFKQFVLINVFI